MSDCSGSTTYSYASSGCSYSGSTTTSYSSGCSSGGTTSYSSVDDSSKTYSSCGSTSYSSSDDCTKTYSSCGSTSYSSKDPNALDDRFVFTADQLDANLSGVFKLNVLANDVSYKPMRLYALDDSSFKDLRTADKVGVYESTAGLNKISITADNQVNFQVSAATKALVDGLAVGESYTDSFVYAMKTGCDTEYATVKVTFTGVNHAPVVTGVSTIAPVVEDQNPDATGLLHSAVTVSFSDVNVSDVLTYSVSADPSNAMGGHLVATGSNNTGSTGTQGFASFDYQLDNNSIQYLAQGQTLTERFTVTADDGHGGTVSQLLEFKIVGTNDAPVFQFDAGKSSYSFASVNEQQYPGVAVGTVHATDIDGKVVAYNIVGGDPNHQFKIDSNGVISTATALKYSDASAYDLTVQAVDDFGATATSTVHFGVNQAVQPYTYTMTFEPTQPVQDVWTQFGVGNFAVPMFNFSNLFAFNGPAMAPSGYYNGMVSKDWVGLNGFGGDAVITSADVTNDFSLKSGYFTGAWNNDLHVLMQAWDHGTFKGQTEFVVQYDKPTFVQFDANIFTSIDELHISSSGGTDANPNDLAFGPQVAMDNLLFGFDHTPPDWMVKAVTPPPPPAV